MATLEVTPSISSIQICTVVDFGEWKQAHPDCKTSAVLHPHNSFLVSDRDSVEVTREEIDAGFARMTENWSADEDLEASDLELASVFQDEEPLQSALQSLRNYADIPQPRRDECFDAIMSILAAQCFLAGRQSLSGHAGERKVQS